MEAEQEPIRHDAARLNSERKTIQALSGCAAHLKVAVPAEQLRR